MTIVRRPSPFGELLSLRQAMDRLFEDSFVRPGSWGSTTDSQPLALDVRTTSDELIVEASLPGVKPDDVDITVEGGTLTINAQSSSENEQHDEGVLVKEIRRGTYIRSISMPQGLEADKATASFENGILNLRIPKAEQVKPRQIRINATSGDAEPIPAKSSNGSARTPSGSRG